MSEGTASMFSRSSIFIVINFIATLHFAHCDIRELYNTKIKTSDLKWVPATSSGWEEVSGFDQDQAKVVRYYQICKSKLPDQNNWIRSPFIDARGATRLHIELEFSITSCDTLDAEHCRETFNIYYYPNDADVASSTFPPWRENPYLKVDTVAANTHGNINRKSFTIGPLNRRGLYVAAQDQGACMSINSMRVYYFYCPSVTDKLTVFPETTSGSELTTLLAVPGKCVADAQPISAEEAPTYHCGGDGKWQIFKSECRCNPGFKANAHGTICHPCQPGTFKSDAESDDCIPCPENSGPGPNNTTVSTPTGTVYCPCLSGFFRTEKESKASSCTKPPSAPIPVKQKANASGASIQWATPADLGGRTDITYSVGCFECSNKDFRTCKPCSPSVNLRQWSYPTGGKVTISGLKPFTPYLIKIFAKNGVSELSPEDDEVYEARIVTLEAAPSTITSIYVAERSTTSVDIKWRPPQPINGVIQEYELEVIPADNARQRGAPAAPIQKTTKETTFKIEGLESNRNYEVRIRAVNSAGPGQLSEKVQFSTMPEVSSPLTAPDSNNTVIIVAVVAVVGVVIVVVIIFLLYRSKGHMPALPGNKQKSAQNGHAGNQERDSLIGHRIYVEYPNPRQAVQTLNRELSPEDLTVLEKLIGEGEFAQVLHGKLMVDGKSCRVAVKQLKHGASVKDQSNFLREACSMAQFDHCNILQLKGVITKSRPVMLITEYMENGALDEFLTKHHGDFDAVQLISMLRGIANGMRYLSDIQYVHRDLAARNILINSDLVCKVSDFGLSRTLENDPHATYTTQGGKIAIRWAAPECIRYRQFTSASDVWSYGIVMWEVMSYGEKPYWDMTNQQVVQNIESGMRLPAPTDCPKILHDKMIECWSLDPKNRPSFSRLVSDLDCLKKAPRLLGSEFGNGDIPANNSSNTLAGACATPNLQHALNHGEITCVEEWLRCQKLDKYKDRFLAHGLDTLDKVSNLTIKDLRALGIDVTLHVHKLENGIRSLRRHLSTSSSRPASSVSPDEMDQGDDDVMMSSIEEEGRTKPTRNGSLRLQTAQDETTILIPEGSVAV